MQAHTHTGINNPITYFSSLHSISFQLQSIYLPLLLLPFIYQSTFESMSGVASLLYLFWACEKVKTHKEYGQKGTHTHTHTPTNEWLDGWMAGGADTRAD